MTTPPSAGPPIMAMLPETIWSAAAPVISSLLSNRGTSAWSDGRCNAATPDIHAATA